MLVPLLAPIIWILGKTRDLKTILSTYPFQIVEIPEQELANAQHVKAYLQHAHEPSLVIAMLPGPINQLGSNRDRRILTAIERLTSKAQRHLILANNGNPAWNI